MNPVKSNHGQLSILRGQYCPKHISRTGCPGSWGHKPSIQYHCLPRHTFTGGGGSHKKRTIRSTSQKFLLCTRWYHFGSVSNKTKQLVLQVLTQGIPFFGWLRWLYHPAWVRNWYSENSCVKHLISLIHNQRLTCKGPTPLHSSVLKPLISSRLISIQNSEPHIWTATAFTSAANSLLPGLQNPFHQTNQEELLLKLFLLTVSYILLICLFSQTDWGLICKVFPHMKVLSHFHWHTLIILFCIFLVLPCLWFLHAIFQNWVEYLSRCKKEELLQRLAKLRRGEKTEKLIVRSASSFSYFRQHFESLVPHHIPRSTAVCLQM